MAGAGKIKDKGYRKYVESKMWQCEDSPTGAHHWIETSEHGTFKCKWCGRDREFPKTFNDAVRWVERYTKTKDPLLEEVI